MILINLLPPELRRKETPKFVLPEIPVQKTLLVLAAAVLVLQILLSIVALFYSTRYKIAQNETAKLSVKLESVRQAKKKISVAGKKMQDIRTLTEKKFYWTLILNEISMTATRGIWLRSLSVEEMDVPKPVKEVAAPKEKTGKTTKEKMEKKKPEETKDSKKKPAGKSSSTKKNAAEMETYSVMKLEGSCSGGAGQETALIGKYLKSLRDNAYFRELFDSNINLSGMNQRKLGEADVFDFIIYCRFKKEKP